MTKGAISSSPITNGYVIKDWTRVLPDICVENNERTSNYYIFSKKFSSNNFIKDPQLSTF